MRREGESTASAVASVGRSSGFRRQSRRRGWDALADACLAADDPDDLEGSEWEDCVFFDAVPDIVVDTVQEYGQVQMEVAGDDWSSVAAPAAPSPSIVTFFPEEYSGETVDGAFLVDSFYYLKSRKNTVEYLPELLSKLRRETGLVFMAVCSGGAVLCKPKDKRCASF